MSNQLKLILTGFFLIQISMVSWSFFEKKQENDAFEERFSIFSAQPDSVTFMDLSDWQINHLPKDMTKFNNLKYLNLDNNNFKEIPSVIWKLPNLEVLILKRNNIKKVSFQQNHTLKKLDLSLNQLTAVKYLEKLTALEYIDLGYNVITDFPLIKSDSNLDTILIHNNEQKFIIDVDKQLKKSINYLDLSNNEFTTFPYFFVDGYQKVKHLKIANCKINEFGNVSLDAIFMEKLDMSNNNFFIRDNQLDQFPNLKELNISGLNIDNLKIQFNSLETLDIHSVGVYGDDLEFDLPNLKELYIDEWFLDFYWHKLKINQIETINIYREDNLTDLLRFEAAFPNAVFNTILIN